MTVLPVTTADRIHTIRRTLPDGVHLVAVSKKMPSTAVRAAYEAGVRDFGESRIQEAIAKQAELEDLTDITWHFIGHLQTNKVRKALAHFQWIHSVDSLKLAQRLDHYGAELDKPPNCCLQVKLRADPSKSGFSETALWDALPELSQLHHLNICGLMVIPPFGLTVAESQKVFDQAHTLVTQINDGITGIQLTELSMGMSSDYSLAIAAGSTLVRLGTILFGDREGQRSADLS
jgi:hypothetical protein